MKPLKMDASFAYAQQSKKKYFFTKLFKKKPWFQEKKLQR